MQIDRTSRMHGAPYRIETWCLGAGLLGAVVGGESQGGGRPVAAQSWQHNRRSTIVARGQACRAPIARHGGEIQRASVCAEGLGGCCILASVFGPITYPQVSPYSPAQWIQVVSNLFLGMHTRCVPTAPCWHHVSSVLQSTSLLAIVGPWRHRYDL